MSVVIIRTANDRTKLIDAGKDFKIPQYIHFFLLTLEELLKQSLLDTAVIPKLMVPFNEGYLKLVEFLKAGTYSRRHVDSIVEKFNQGYSIVLESPHVLTAQGTVHFWTYGHIIISKICHLVRYEQRYLLHNQTASTMLETYSWDDLFAVTKHSKDEKTCKSKENLEFSCGKFYVDGCKANVKLIHSLLVSLYYEGTYTNNIDQNGIRGGTMFNDNMYDKVSYPTNSHNDLKHLIYRVLQLHDGIYRLDNLVSRISKETTIQRTVIRRELTAVQRQFNTFEMSLSKLLTHTIISSQSMGAPQYLKSLAINTASLQWGLYFLTLTYGGGYIDQYGQIQLYGQWQREVSIFIH